MTVILMALGLLLIFDVSASTSLERLFSDDPYFVVKHQLVMMAVGVVAALVAAWLPADLYSRWPRLVYFAGLILLALPLVVGDASHGARRWIEIAGISVQTSEFAKLAFIIFFAHLCLQTRNEWMFLLWLAPPAVLMLLQKDFGTLLIIAAAAGVTYFLAGASWWQVGKILALGLVAGLVLIFSSDYRRERLSVYLAHAQGEEQTEVDDYHVKQLQYAIGRGRLFGQGIGQSRQKFKYLPEVHTDSIFAILAEEMGFMGVLLLFFIYACFLLVLVWIAGSAALTREQQLIGYGIFVSLVCQVFVNLAAISGVTPLTGITLPFLSYGGSSLIATLVFTGVMASLSRVSESAKPEYTIKRKRYV